MKYIKTISIGLVVFVLLVALAQKSNAQQNVQFTQYMYDGSLINPAYVGADEALSLTFVHRDQWSGVEGAPQSQTFSAHTLFKKQQFGLGLIAHHETIGIHRALNAGLNYAYHLPVGREKYLSFGLQTGIFNRRSDYQAVQNGTTDPSVGNNFLNDTEFDMGLGILYRSEKFQMGYSVPEVFSRKIMLTDTSEIDLGKVNHLLFTRFQFPVSSTFTIQPGFLLKYLAGVPLSYDVNLSATYREVLSAGVSYRKNESIDFLLRLHVTPQFQLGYAYDYPIGDIGQIARASNEILVRYVFKYNYSKVISPR